MHCDIWYFIHVHFTVRQRSKQLGADLQSVLYRKIIWVVSIKMNVLAVLIFSAVLATVICMPDGPPASTCASLTPGHTASSDTGASPYEVTVTPTMYGPGDAISVTVQKIDDTAGTPDFRGIMVQARLKSGGTTPLGTFSTPSTGTKLMTCTTADSTWSHGDRTDKMTATATWTAPMSADQDMVFVATVVQINMGGSSVWWEGLTVDLTYNGPIPTEGPMTTGGAMTTMKPTTGPTTGPTAKSDAGATASPMPTDDAGYLRASLICTGLALFAIALVGRRL